MSQSTPAWPSASTGRAACPLAILSTGIIVAAIAWSHPSGMADARTTAPGLLPTDRSIEANQEGEPRLWLDGSYTGHQSEGYPSISTPSKALTLSFLTRGLVSKVLVEETQRVAAGALLVQLDDRVQQYALEAQKLAAEDDTGVLTAERRLELAEFDLANVLETERANAAAPREVERAKAERALAELNLQAAMLERKTSQLAYERDLAFSEHYRIISNIDAIVARIDVHEGESVDELQPAIHLVTIDPLWMDVAVPIQLGMTLKPGDTARVRWRDLPDQPDAAGTVLWIAPVADASSNRIIVRLEIANSDALPAGLHALVSFPMTGVGNLAVGTSSP